MRRKQPYQSQIDDLLKFFGSNHFTGLSNDLFFRQKKRYGSNRILLAKAKSIFAIFLLELKKPLFFVMMVMCLIDIIIHSNDSGSYSGWLLLTVLLMNASLGTWQEWRSAKMLDKIKHQEHSVCMVLRNSKVSKVNDFQLVPGDIVLLSAGQKVPADLRLLESEGLVADEFVLFGSTEAKPKHNRPILDNNLPLYQWDNCCFKGTKIIAGKAKGLVYGIGVNTELGKIKQLSQSIQNRLTPIESELKKGAIFIAYFLLVLSLPMLWINIRATSHHLEELLKLFVGGNTNTFSILLAFADFKNGVKNVIEETITLGSALMPIGLPLQLYFGLLIALRKFPLTDVIFKKLSSIETLGSITTVVLDKTGTMSSNEMVIQRLVTAEGVLHISGKGYSPDGDIKIDNQELLNNSNYNNYESILQATLFCTHEQNNPPTAAIPYWHARGEATDAAFAAAGQKILKSGLKSDTNKQLIQIFEFEPSTQRSSMLWRLDGINRSFVKGTIESVLEASLFYIKDQRRFRLDADSRAMFLALANEYEKKEFRIIALATKELNDFSYYTTEDTEQRLDFIGFACLADPPHEDMPLVIEELKKLDVNIVVVTGDSPGTTRALSRRIGLTTVNQQAPRAIYFNQKTAEDYERLKQEKVLILGRSSAENKQQFIKELQENGEIVAVIGDGVNDAAAIKQADVGVALAIRGADETIEAAQMALVKDKLSFFAYGLAESKALSLNIAIMTVSYLSLLFAEGFVAFADYFLPNNVLIDPSLIVLSDVVAVTAPLSVLVYDKHSFQKGHKHQKLLSANNLLTGVGFGAAIAIITFITNYLAIHFSGTQTSYTFLTFAGLVLLTTQTIMYKRAPKHSIFSSQTLNNNALLIAIGWVFFCILALFYIPVVSKLFGSTYQQVGWFEWLLLLGSSLVYGIILEALRFINTKKEPLAY